jgi:dCTP deaminase
MAVLSDRDIVLRVQNGTLGIKPFNPSNLTSNGYDLTIKEIFIPPNSRHEHGLVRIHAGSWMAISTIEYVKMPLDLVGFLWTRTSYGRKGLFGSYGVVDAGFQGELTLSYYATHDVEAQVGSRIAQLVFCELSSPSEQGYAARSGNFQGQVGVTLTSKDKNSTPGA